MDIFELLNQILNLVKNIGGMDTKMAIGAVVTVLLSLWKSSILRPLWDKLGASQVLVAPVLGLVAALVAMPVLNLGTVWAGIQSGLLAIAFHEVVSALEAVPWIGDKYKQWIDFVDKLLFRPKDEAQKK